MIPVQDLKALRSELESLNPRRLAISFEANPPSRKYSVHFSARNRSSSCWKLVPSCSQPRSVLGLQPSRFAASPKSGRFPGLARNKARNAPRLGRPFRSAAERRRGGDLWARDDASVPCLAHLDPHIGNTYVGPDGKPRFLDWQVVHLAPGVDDVSYFIVGAMDIEERRKNERDLVRHYLHALGQNGGPKLDFHLYWDDYRRHHLHGVLWAATPPIMQPMSRVQTMAHRHLVALKDHDALMI